MQASTNIRRTPERREGRRKLLAVAAALVMAVAALLLTLALSSSIGPSNAAVQKELGSTVRLSQTLRERGLLLAQSAPHGKTKAQTPNRNSSLSLQRLPPLRQKRTRKSQRA